MTETPIKPVLIGSQALRPGFMVYEMGPEIQELGKTLARTHKGKPLRAILAQFPKSVYPLVKEAEIDRTIVSKKVINSAEDSNPNLDKGGRPLFGKPKHERKFKGFRAGVGVHHDDQTVKETRHHVKHKDGYIYAVCLNKRSALKRLIKYFQANDRL